MRESQEVKLQSKESLPSGWSFVRVGDIISALNGRAFKSSEWRTSGLPIIRIQNLKDASAEFNYFEGNLEDRHKVRNGDLLFAWSGTPGTSFGAHVWRGGDAALNQHIFRIDFCAEAFNNEFLCYALNQNVRKYIEQAQGGVGLAHITKTKFNESTLPIPPRKEQDRIVDRLEQLFSRIEEGERALERVQKLVERYRQSVLKAAVTGELTRKWRETNKDKVESGEVLLARILKARREAWEKTELGKMKAEGITPANDKWKQKYREPAVPDTSNLPQLPEGWAWATVELLCFVDTGATPKRGTARYFKGGTINWITSAAVNDPLIQSAAERITPVAIQETNAKVFPVGSLIVAMYGEGKTRGKVSELGIEAATNQACAALLCGHLDAAIKVYVRTFFEKNYAALRAEAAGGVQPNLNLAIIKGTALPLPPLTELALINEVVATRMSQITASTSVFPAWAKQSKALRQKILCHAFAGELVPQDLSDEPAANLLERIASEPATASSADGKQGLKNKTPEPA